MLVIFSRPIFWAHGTKIFVAQGHQLPSAFHHGHVPLALANREALLLHEGFGSKCGLKRLTQTHLDLVRMCKLCLVCLVCLVARFAKARLEHQPNGKPLQTNTSPQHRFNSTVFGDGACN